MTMEEHENKSLRGKIYKVLQSYPDGKCKVPATIFDVAKHAKEIVAKQENYD